MHGPGSNSTAQGGPPARVHCALACLTTALAITISLVFADEVNRESEVMTVLLSAGLHAALLLLISLRQAWAAVLFAGTTGIGLLGVIYLLVASDCGLSISGIEGGHLFLAFAVLGLQTAAAGALVSGEGRSWLGGVGGGRAWWAALTALLFLAGTGMGLLHFRRHFAEQERIFWAENADEFLRQAAIQNDAEQARVLIEEKGANIDRPDEEGAAPLHMAAHGDSPDAARLLLDRGANLECRDEAQRTPLSIAASRGHREVASVLLKRGGEIDVRDHLGWTPLLAASVNDHPDTVALLLQHRADPNQKVYGKTSLHFAANRGKDRIVTLLLDAGAEVNSPGKEGATPLMEACEHGNIDTIELLLKRGAEVRATDSHGRTPLHVAVGSFEPKLVDLLLDHGGLVNARDRGGQTPLHAAVEQNKLEMTHALLNRGARINARDRQGRTPLGLTSADDPGDLPRLLRRRGGRR